MAAATTTPVVSPAPVSPVSKTDTFIKTLMDPEARKAASDKLDAEAAELEARLAQIRAARNTLDAAGASNGNGEPTQRRAASAKPGRAAASPSGARRGRPPGPGVNHGSAIVAALKGQRNGLNRAELIEALRVAKHDIEPGTLSTYLTKMVTAEQLKTSGEARSYRYSVVRSAAKA